MDGFNNSSDYDKYRIQLALCLIDAKASNIQFYEQDWKVTFKIKETEFYCFFDDGIDCMYADGTRFFAPLEWGDEYLKQLTERLQNYAQNLLTN